MPISSVKEVKDLVLVYESDGAGTVYWLTDMPGGAMAVRKTIDGSSNCKIQDTNGKRETVRIPLDGIEGQLHQLKVVPGSTTMLKLFEGFIRYRVIGVFVDGHCGEIFETPELSFGS